MFQYALETRKWNQEVNLKTMGKKITGKNILEGINGTNCVAYLQ